jgi:hypothetical protein
LCSALALGLGICGCSASAGFEESAGTVAQGVSSADALGFESSGLWSTTTAGAVLSSSTSHTQGTRSLAVRLSNTNGYTPIASVPLSTLPAVSPTLALDFMLPTQQANPYWLGTLQIYVDCPSRNVYSAFLAQVDLTNKPLNVWNTATFPLTTAELTSLLGGSYADLKLTVVLNAQVPTSGTYLFDNLRFLPQAASGCGGQPNGVLCDDGNACTLGDSCQAGVCTGTAKSCAAADQCHAAGICNATTGACSTGPALADWTPCNDGDLCTRSKACQAGVCSGGQPTCDDGDLCTIDTCSATNGACSHAAMSTDACASANGSPPGLKGRVSYVNEADNNRCVPDALHVLNRLNARGDLIGWHYLENGYAPLDDEHFHTETIVRMPVVSGTPLDGSFFVSSWSHPPGEAGAVMGVAKMGFKGGHQGKVLLTNRAFNGGGPDSTPEWSVAPNPSDAFMKLGPAQTPGVVLDPTGVQNHPGGLSALGSHVAVSLQGFVENCGAAEILGWIGIEAGGCTPDSSEPIVQIWDLADPLNPLLRSSYITHENGVETTVNLAGGDEPPDLFTFTPGTSMMAVAITKLADGRFLMVGDPDVPVSQFEFYVSKGTSLDDPNLWGDPRRVPDAVVPMGSNPPGWQSFNFVTDCNGDLFILGMRGNAGSPGDEDAVENYKVTIAPAAPGSSCGTAYCATMTRADQVEVTTIHGDLVVHELSDGQGYKHMQCGNNSNNDECDMQSGAGSYVDPNGEVIIYATEFDEGSVFSQDTHGHFFFSPTYPFVYGNGHGAAPGFSPATPYPNVAGFLRGMEFHERHGNLAVGSACPTLQDAWVEFYENENFNSFGNDPGQVYRINYTTRDERENWFFGANDFNDKATAVRWCIPQGSSFRVYHDVLSGPSAVLNGTGQVAQIANLGFGSVYTHPDGSAAAGGTLTDSITSGVFQENVDDPLLGLVGVPDATN